MSDTAICRYPNRSKAQSCPQSRREFGECRMLSITRASRPKETEPRERNEDHNHRNGCRYCCPLFWVSSGTGNPAGLIPADVHQRPDRRQRAECHLPRNW